MRVRMFVAGGNATLKQGQEAERNMRASIAIATNTSIRSFPMPESRERPVALVGCTAAPGAHVSSGSGHGRTTHASSRTVSSGSPEKFVKL